jgi:hypothetical protein
MSFSLPPIEDEALRKFCEKHNLYEAVAAGYHYAQKFFPKAKKIEIDFHPPYRDDEPEEAEIIFVIKSSMTVDEVLEAEDRFIKVTNDVPGAFYLVTSHRFIE